MSSCKIITELLSNIIIYCIFSETLIRYEENKKDFMKFRQLGKKWRASKVDKLVRHFGGKSQC